MERTESREIPQEVWEQIFKRLTYKDLARFRCVCKNWYAILKDPIFLSSHTKNFIEHYNGGDNALLRLAYPTIFGKGFESYKLYSLSAMEDDRSAVETFRPKFNMLSTKFRISGHCNGILCLATTYWPRSLEVLLYNPATRECMCLPDSDMRKITQYLDIAVAITVGMGYDSETGDYKVMRVWRVHRFDDVLNCTNLAEEYSLSTNSWTRLKNNFGNFHFHDESFALFFNRTYYWWAICPRNKRHVILEFNMECRVFRPVRIPVNLRTIDTVAKTLTVWRDTISLVCSSAACTDVWIKNQTQEGSWAKMHRLIHRDVSRPLIFWKGYNELLLEMSNGEIKSYDFETREIKDVKVKGDPIQQLSQAVNYEATTVSLGAGATYLV